MIETHRMLGRERQADLLREAERFHVADHLPQKAAAHSPFRLLRTTLIRLRLASETATEPRPDVAR
jgi:hypothetical protein